MHSTRHSKDSIHENETQKYLDCYLENQNINTIIGTYLLTYLDPVPTKYVFVPCNV